MQIFQLLSAQFHLELFEEKDSSFFPVPVPVSHLNLCAIKPKRNTDV